MRLPALLAACSIVAAATASRADPISQAGDALQGRIQFVMVGASMVDSSGLTNGVNCLEPRAAAVVSAEDLPLRARLLSATLYVGGSLIAEDGLDYEDPDLAIFETPGITWDTHPGEVEQRARQAADTSVQFRPPGASAALTVSAPPGTSFVAGHYVPQPPEQGNVAFFVTRINVTEAILDAGGGLLEGRYEVSGLLADVCLGREVVCAEPPAAPVSCLTTPGSAPHTNGAASFALLLVVEAPEMPLHSVTVFEGLYSLSGEEIPLPLRLTNAVSNPAVGSLALYALEGDLLMGAEEPGFAPCGGREYIEVDGDADVTRDGLCLVDDDNPLGNIFNSSINVQPDDGGAPQCESADESHCCLGDGLCGVTGVDIDRFDISPALVAGARDLEVRIGSRTPTGSVPNDRVALSVVVVGVNVFEPVLALDTQIRVLDQLDGHVRVGNRVVFSVAVSNTGNVRATNVGVEMPAPANVTDLEVLRKPAGATDQSITSGGPNGSGVVRVSGFDVPAGEIAEVRVSVLAPCAAAGTTLNSVAEITSAELAAFSISGPTVDVRGPDPACPGIDPHGPFGLGRVLRGGGGCQASAAGLLAALSSLALLWRRCRRRGLGLLAAVLALGLAAAGCGNRRAHDDRSPARIIDSLDGLPGTTCGSALMVQVDRADGTRFCIDRFEAGLDGGARGDTHQALDDTGTSTNGTTRAKAVTGLQLQPAADISWYQARAACVNAGKRLCTLAEWERACRGPEALIYPYGDTIDDSACNGFFSYSDERPSKTGSWSACGGTLGVYDLSGNLEEWVLDAVPRVPGSAVLDDRAVRGGSFKSNSQALACFGDEFHEPPGSTDVDRGFRCCSDGPG